MGINIGSILILFALISVIFITIGSVKLVRTKNVPGSRMIFASVIGYILTIFLPDIDSGAAEASLAVQGMVVAINSALMLLAAFGFFRLASYVANRAERD